MNRRPGAVGVYISPDLKARLIQLSPLFYGSGRAGAGSGQNGKYLIINYNYNIQL